MNLLTLADGFGDSVAVPSWYPKYYKWPKIIELMTRKLTVNNLSRYGAGNEYLVNALRQNIKSSDAVLLQWAVPNRLDLMLTGHTKPWREIIATDPVYHDNVVELNDHSFWLSSGSKLPTVQEYHGTYISMFQHRLRSQLFIDYAKLLIDQHQVEYRFMLTWDSLYLANQVADDINWSCHQPLKGMHDFRNHSEFSELDLGITQPIPLIHYDFVRKFIMPYLDLPWRSDRELAAVESMLYRHYKESIPNKPNDTN